MIIIIIKQAISCILYYIKLINYILYTLMYNMQYTCPLYVVKNTLVSMVINNKVILFYWYKVCNVRKVYIFLLFKSVLGIII
jgi:hypothetical protein